LRRDLNSFSRWRHLFVVYSAKWSRQDLEFSLWASAAAVALATRLEIPRLAVLFFLCVVASGCSDSRSTSSTSPTTPTALPPPTSGASLQGRWEGSYLYERTEPAGCPVIGLNGPTCPTAPVPMTLTLTQMGNAFSGELTSSIFGDAGANAGPFPLTGRLDAPSSLELTGEQPGGDPSCMHTTVRRMVSFTLRRTNANGLEGTFHFDGDRRSSSCFFFDVQVYAREVCLIYVSPL